MDVASRVPAECYRSCPRIDFAALVAGEDAIAQSEGEDLRLARAAGLSAGACEMLERRVAAAQRDLDQRVNNVMTGIPEGSNGPWRPDYSRVPRKLAHGLPEKICCSYSGAVVLPDCIEIDRAQ